MPYKNGRFVMKDRPKFSDRSRTQNANVLGRAPVSSGSSQYCRKDILKEVDSYLNNTQYNNLAAWDAVDAVGDPLPLKKRKPRIIYNLGKRIIDTMASKLLGPRVFPSIVLPEDPSTKELIDHIIKITDFKAKAVDIGRYMGAHGSCFMRFKFSESRLVLERYNSNYCYPTFDKTGQELEKMEIKYVYSDLEDKDEKGNPKKKWFKLELGKEADILYDNPEVSESGEEPAFQVVNVNKHELGFVQGQWFKVGDDKHDPDGPSLVGEILGFIDAFNYSLSQSDNAVSYNQDPQLMLKGMDNDEIDDLVKSSSKAWTLGREGDASYLETGLGGVQTAGELRQKFREGAGDVTRVVLLDPEKMVGSAQSAKAMEVLHAPLLDLIDEYRPYAERGIITLLQKMVAAVLLMNDRGFEIAGITIPKGYAPLTLNISLLWPPVFPMTMQDLQQKVSVASQAASGNIISRETLTRWLAKDFGIEDVEEEIQKIAEQPVLNPFGF